MEASFKKLQLLHRALIAVLPLFIATAEVGRVQKASGYSYENVDTDDSSGSGDS